MLTPLRSQGTRTDDGWVLLRDVGSNYADGGEQRVYEILKDSTDLSAASDELLPQATNWAEHYHLTPNRSNVLRPFDLPADATVLEIGAGCGAVTRYLGETCAVVDSIEPVPSRAKALRERTRDLPNVEVFVGEVDDIPAEAAYDLVVVVGVLEYVGNGTDDLTPYRTFLDGLVARLKPGGSLLLAIENKLGAKYFSGAPEDHSSRYFDGLEDYPGNNPARTFSRRELVALMNGAGLDTAEPLVAFPDYKMTRTVLDPGRLTGAAESLLARVPNFPSPDHTLPREVGPDERLLWRSFVQAGLAGETGNSFVVLGGKGAPSKLWADDTVGVFFSGGRRSVYSVQTRIVGSGDDLQMVRSRMADREWPGALSIRTDTAPFVPGTDLLDVFVDTDDEQSLTWLTEWKTMLDELDPAVEVPLDLVPRNLVVGPDNHVVAIDDEWRLTGATAADVLHRGVLLLGVDIALRKPLRGRWEGATTFRDATLRIGAAVGLDEPDWLDRAIAAESELQAGIALLPEYLVPAEDLANASANSNNAILDGSIAELATFGSRSPSRLVELAEARAAADTLRHELHLARVDADHLRQRAEQEGLRAEQEGIRADTQQHRANLEMLRANALTTRSEMDQVELRIRAEALAALERRLRAESDAHAGLRATVGVLRGEVEHFRNDVRSLSGQTSDLQGELDRTRATISWKVTKPLRWVRRMGR